MTTEKKKPTKKPAQKTCTALKKLCTSNGVMVNIGDEFTCSTKDYAIYKDNKAV